MRSQVHDGEYADPDYVESVPKQTEAEQAASDHRLKAECAQLREHYDEPCHSGGHVQPVRADEGLESR